MPILYRYSVILFSNSFEISEIGGVVGALSSSKLIVVKTGALIVSSSKPGISSSGISKSAGSGKMSFSVFCVKESGSVCVFCFCICTSSRLRIPRTKLARISRGSSGGIVNVFVSDSLGGVVFVSVVFVVSVGL